MSINESDTLVFVLYITEHMYGMNSLVQKVLVCKIFVEIVFNFGKKFLRVLISKRPDKVASN